MISKSFYPPPTGDWWVNPGICRKC